MHATLRDSPCDTSVHPFSASSFRIPSSSRPVSALLLLLFFAEEKSENKRQDEEVRGDDIARATV